MYNPFTDHPSKVDETYFEHMQCAFKFFYTLLRLSFAALVHSIFPFWFEHTASSGIKKLNDCMQDRKLGTDKNKSYFPPNNFPLPTVEDIKSGEKND